MRRTDRVVLVVLAAIFGTTTMAYWGCGASPKPCPEAKIPTAPLTAGAADRPVDYSVSISGSVRQPVSLTRLDLMSHQSVTVKLNDVATDGAFRGVFRLRGVPLRNLLELAHIQKESSIFNRDMDLAIVVTGADGHKAVLSWGEVYYRNPAEFVIA